MRIPGLLLLVLLVLAPTGVGMEAHVEGAPEAPIEPETGTATVTMVALIGCEEALPRVSAEGALLLTWRPTAPSQVILVGPQTILVDATSCLTSPLDPLRAEAGYEVAVTRDLLALQDTPVMVEVTLEGGEVAEALTAETSFSVQADVFLLIRPRLAQKVIQGSPGKDTSVTLEVENFGNTPTLVTLTLLDTPERAAVTLPEPFLLDSPNQEGGKTSATAGVLVRPERGANQGIQILITPTAAQDPTRTDEGVVADLLVRDGSLLGRVTPAPPVLPVLLVVFALAASRRLPRNDR